MARTREASADVLATLAAALPAPPRPAGAYRPVVVRGGVGFVSGQFPIEAGALKYKGRIGAGLSTDEGRAAAMLAAVNVLAQINVALQGFRRFAGLYRIDGFIASAPGYGDQPRVLDAASDYLVEVLGPALGAHARSAIAVAELPLDSPIELVATFHYRSRARAEAGARDPW